MTYNDEKQQYLEDASAEVEALNEIAIEEEKYKYCSRCDALICSDCRVQASAYCTVCGANICIKCLWA